jgi:polyvinyl alcohol dehydrogenase (cytochrome)
MLTRSLLRPGAAFVLLAGLQATVASAQEQRADHPGRAAYQQYCAACHNQPGTRAPALSALQQMSEQTLRFTLTEGLMRQQG